MAARTKTLLGILVVFIAVFLVIRYQKDTDIPKTQVQQGIALTPIQDKEVHSSDGTMNLSMKVEGKKNEPNTYSFFVSEISGKGKKLLFTKTLGPMGSMLLPSNSWSPNNKYLFLQEKEDASMKTFVFKASGEVFAKGEQYLDVGLLFAQRNTKYSLKDVTGWDDPLLLHVTTMLDAHTQGPSFWFDLTSLTFLQLASR